MEKIICISFVLFIELVRILRFWSKFELHLYKGRSSTEQSPFLVRSTSLDLSRVHDGTGQSVQGTVGVGLASDRLRSFLLLVRRVAWTRSKHAVKIGLFKLIWKHNFVAPKIYLILTWLNCTYIFFSYSCNTCN